MAVRYGSVILLRDDRRNEYVALHKNVWPEVLEQIRRSNIVNYSIFLHDGLLFSYFEYVGDDFAADIAAMAADEATRRWWELTDPCQEPVSAAVSGERWAQMTEVFHSD
ncbi:MAG: L-rhamnose mutarotase [Gaiellaceae bacterium]